MVIDGNFPTVKSPNPENPEGFYLAVDLAKEVGSDLIIGTDPDSDRVGTMVRGKDGEYHTITGNQMGVLLLDYIINARKATGTMPENPAFLKTIVTTNMGREVAERNGVHVDETFTGFKFMAEKLAEYKREGSYNYLLAYEESYGYMVGDYVRDKDAVTASMLIAEMAASYFKQGMTLADALDALYEKYGYFGELTMNLVMPGLDGLEKMRAIMAKLRAEPPKEIGGEAVLGMRDYQSGTVSVAELGVVGKTPIVGSNVLYFELADGTAFIVRPSGTEPKIKVYILAQGESRADCDGRIARYKAFAETLKDLAENLTHNAGRAAYAARPWYAEKRKQLPYERISPALHSLHEGRRPHLRRGLRHAAHIAARHCRALRLGDRRGGHGLLRHGPVPARHHHGQHLDLHRPSTARGRSAASWPAYSEIARASSS